MVMHVTEISSPAKAAIRGQTHDAAGLRRVHAAPGLVPNGRPASGGGVVHVRALRLRLGLRQQDVAMRAHVSQQHVSDLERGQLGGMRFDDVRAMLAVVDARLVVTRQLARWASRPPAR